MSLTLQIAQAILSVFRGSRRPTDTPHFDERRDPGRTGPIFWVTISRGLLTERQSRDREI